MNLHWYDLVIINSSGGKDSVASIFEVMRLAVEQGYDTDRVYVSHQDLGSMEWPGTTELVKKQADHFNLPLIISRREDDTILEYAERRGKWPSRGQRWCTSDFKREPGAKVLRRLAPGRKDVSVLYVFGFRAEESPARSQKEPLSIHPLSTKSGRVVHEWLPIHHWTTAEVWDVIKSNGLPYHPAYDLGMPRLSCVLCIFSPKSALVLAGKHNPELLDKYVEVEKRIDHTFRMDVSLAEVKEAVEAGEVVEKVENWVM